MVRGKTFRVVVASDGSVQAKRAASVAAEFPWPEPTLVRAVVARRTRAEYRRSILLAALDRNAELAARAARQVLTRRWPDAEVTIVDKAPQDAVLAEAERFGANVIVVGWRGHGLTRRLLMGSVSRAIARRATTPVLVVRRRPAEVSRIVIALDGSANARRAVRLVANLRTSNAEVTLFTAVEATRMPTQILATAAARTSVSVALERTNAERIRTAKAAQESAAAHLRRRGWRVKLVVTTGEPLRDLLASAATARAHVVVVGARGVRGVRQLLLGSVAEGVLNRCPVTVLVVR